jgi:hypothetical protein
MVDGIFSVEDLARSSERIGSEVGAIVLMECVYDTASAMHGIRCYLGQDSDNPLAIEDCRDPSLARVVFRALSVIEKENIAELADEMDRQNVCRAHYRQALERLIEPPAEDKYD